MENENIYQITMSIVKTMLKKGLISKSEYKKINKIMIEKYNPPLGELFTDIALT